MRIFFAIFLTLLFFGCTQKPGNEWKSGEAKGIGLQRIDSLIHLSDNYFSSEQFNDSLFDKFLLQAEHIAEQKGFYLEQASIYKVVGKRYRNISEFGEALFFFQRVLEIANQIDNDSLKAYAKHDMAVVFRRIDDNSKALNFHFQALHWAEAQADTFLILASNNGIGNVYFSYNNLPNAIYYYQRSLQLLNSGVDNKLSKAINTNNIADAHLKLGNSDSALFYLNTSYRLNVEMNSKLGQAICENGLGDVYIFLQDYPKAIEHYSKSLQLNREIGNTIYLVGNHLNLGKTYLKTKDFALAKNHLKEAYILAKEVGSKSKIVEALQQTSVLYRISGQKDLALTSLEEAMFYKDTITDEVSRLNSEGATALYKLEKQEHDILILKQKNQLGQLRVNRQRWILLATVVTILGGIIFSIYAIVQRKRNLIFTKKIQRQNKNIRDSINYAKRIQEAVLPDLGGLKNDFADYFVMYKPRDIVSGDFYWYNRTSEVTVIAVVDCTGHGVPGALMSMLGVTLLNEIINTEGIIQPDLVLNKFRELVIEQLKQKGSFDDAKDGMEMALFTINHTTLELKYSGAYYPLFIVSNGQFTHLKPDKMPIGFHPTKNSNFTLKQHQLVKGDVIYSFTDGVYDQFGGSSGTKFMINNLIKLLTRISSEPMQQQYELLENELRDWQGKYEQIDDMTALGLKI